MPRVDAEDERSEVKIRLRLRRFENGREEVVDLLLSPVVVALPEGNVERGLSLGLGDDSAKLVVGSREELPGREVVVVDESAVRHGAVRN